MTKAISPRLILLAVAAGTWVLGGCGDQTSSPSPRTVVVPSTPTGTGDPASSTSGVSVLPAASLQAEHPCSLLTNADAEIVLGKLQRVAPIEDVTGVAHTCVWESESGHITLMTAGTPDGMTFLQSQFGAAGGSNNQDVPGIGDSAGWLEAGPYLLVRKGGNDFVLVAVAPGFTLDTAKSLAEKVIAKL
jgi:hypothetical protein